jgi:hypothetical protein
LAERFDSMQTRRFRMRPPRRLLILAAVLLLSALMHLVLLAWVDDALSGLGMGVQPERETTINVALIPSPAPVPSKPEPPKPEPAKPKPPKPAPKPDADQPAKLGRKATAAPTPGPSVSESAITRTEALAPAESTMVPISPDDFMGWAQDGTSDVPAGETARGAAGNATGSAVGKSAGVATEGAARNATFDTPQIGAQSEAASGQTAGPAKQGVPPLPMPPKGRWRFVVHYGDYREGYQVATLDYAIGVDGNRYQLKTEGRAAGLTALFYSGVLTQRSTGQISALGLMPEHYSERRGKRPERSLSVDLKAGLVSFADNRSVRLVQGAQDRLSVLIQLGLLARTYPERFVSGAVIEIPELTTGDLELTSYTSHGDVLLQTESGTIRALHLERTAPRKSDDNRIDIWLGYDLQLIPVRIRVTDVGGRVLDQFLEQPSAN